MEEHQKVHDTELGRLGYAQELFRTMGGFSNFAIGFSVVSVLTGATTLYDYGLRMGGPAEMTFGWPIVAFFTMFVALSMAELASSLPTSGAMYHWSCELGGKAWGWFTAWLVILGYITALAGIDYGCAQFLMPILGINSTQTNLLLLYGALLISHALINQYGIRLVSWLNDFSVSIHIIGLAVIIGALLILAPKQDLAFMLSQSNRPPEPLPYIPCFILGLLQAQWTLAGYDSCASVSEETVDARTIAPWGMVIAVLVSAVFGYLLLCSLTLAIPDVDQILNAKDSGGYPIPVVVAILNRALGTQFGSFASILAAVAMWFCGLGAVTGCSRLIYAFARDGGMPWSNLLKVVEPKHHVPIAAIWFTCLCSFLAAVSSGAYEVVTSISTVCLYLAYTIPVFLKFRGHYSTPLVKGPWNLGKASQPINLLAILWTIFICSVIGYANHWRAGIAMFSLMLFLALAYYFRERYRFEGPHWIGKGLAIGETGKTN